MVGVGVGVVGAVVVGVVGAVVVGVGVGVVGAVVGAGGERFMTLHDAMMQSNEIDSMFREVLVQLHSRYSDEQKVNFIEAYATEGLLARFKDELMERSEA